MTDHNEELRVLIEVVASLTYDLSHILGDNKTVEYINKLNDILDRMNGGPVV